MTPCQLFFSGLVPGNIQQALPSQTLIVPLHPHQLSWTRHSNKPLPSAFRNLHVICVPQMELLPQDHVGAQVVGTHPKLSGYGLFMRQEVKGGFPMSL